MDDQQQHQQQKEKEKVKEKEKEKESIIVHLVEKWNKYSNDVNIRDKFLKVVQFSCRLSVERLLTASSSSSSASSCHASIQSLSHAEYLLATARKGFRLLKFVQHVAMLIKIFGNDTQLKYWYGRIIGGLEQVFWILRLYFDNKIFLSRAQILKIDIEKTSFYNNLCLFGAIACKCTFVLITNWREILGARRHDGKRKVSPRRTKKSIRLFLRLLLDLGLSFGLVYHQNVSNAKYKSIMNQILSGCGILSGLFELTDAWMSLHNI